jgi:hypothetical protein
LVTFVSKLLLVLHCNNASLSCLGHAAQIEKNPICVVPLTEANVSRNGIIMVQYSYQLCQQNFQWKYSFNNQFKKLCKG